MKEYLTGDAKSRFETWLLDNLDLSKSAVVLMDVEDFYTLPLMMQVGIYDLFFIDNGINLDRLFNHYEPRENLTEIIERELVYNNEMLNNNVSINS